MHELAHGALRERVAVDVLLQRFLDHPEHIFLALHDGHGNSEERAQIRAGRKHAQVACHGRWLALLAAELKILSTQSLSTVHTEICLGIGQQTDEEKSTIQGEIERNSIISTCNDGGIFMRTSESAARRFKILFVPRIFVGRSHGTRERD